MSRWTSLLVVVAGCLFSTVASAGEDPPSPSTSLSAEPSVQVNEASAPAGAAAPAAPLPPAEAAPAPASPRTSAPPYQITDQEHARASAPRKRHRVGLMIAGLAVLAAGYVGSAVSFAASSAVYGEQAAIGPEILIPIAGPWLALSSTKWDAVPEAQRVTGQATMILQGGLQAVGAVLSVVGISRYVASKSGDDAPPRRLSFDFAPTAGGGLGIVHGTF